MVFYSPASYSPPSKKKKVFIILLVCFVVIAVVLGFYFLKPKLYKPRIEYTQVYRLVPEKISQSAAIRINLPPGIDALFAKANIKFVPEIEGQWLAEEKSVLSPMMERLGVVFTADASENSDVIFYKPKGDLNLNRYYSVELATLDGGLVQADFLVVENPEILAIFPGQGTEAPEYSEITIVFNRPMVPLTTLGEVEKKDIPVVVEPETEGRYKWITTRNLQFIPKERLVRSSNYKITIKPGFISMDGLAVQGAESSFYTRKLRYLNITQGNIIYNQPISIYFNQPVDLERTKQEIVLVNNATGKEVPFIAQYVSGDEKPPDSGQSAGMGLFDFGSLFTKANSLFGFANIFGKKDYDKDVQKSVIQIYNQKDRFGRSKLWDFGNTYTLTVKKAYPLEGDIILNYSHQSRVSVFNIIKDITAQSQRTNQAAPDFFDPQGKLWVEFYEEINLNKSKIEVLKLKEIGYGQKCKDEVENMSSTVECEKVDDKKKIYITFKEQEIGLGEKLEINFKEIVNIDGFKINREEMKRQVRSYPHFQITRTLPANNDTNVELTKLVICSNSPILAPEKENFKDYISSNLEYEIMYWSRSWRVTQTFANQVCNLGEFRTQIDYGLMPLSNYSFRLKLEDVFSQKQETELNFSTGSMPDIHLDFYSFQRGYVVAAPKKSKLTYAAKNMEFVNVDICKLEASKFLYYLENSPGYFDSPSAVSFCQQRIQKIIELPRRYWIKNYFHFDINDYFDEPLGHYIITFHHPNYTSSYWQKGTYIYKQAYERTYISVTNLGVSEKQIDPDSNPWQGRALSSEELNNLKNLYWVTNFSNLQPENGAKVMLYRGEQLIPAGTYYTNEQGVALTNVIYDLRGAVISKGEDSTVIPSGASWLNWASSAYSAKKVYLYTDKPIYRPGQTVSLKGIYRIGYDGNYEIYQAKPVDLKVYDAKNDEILSRQLTVNDFGTFNTQFMLEGHAPLGMYRICVDKYYSCTYFDVQEYVPAPFEITVSADKEEYISKDIVNLDIEANYYFGVSLEGGTVEYTVSSQNYYFDRYSDGYFNFGSGWDYWSSYSYGDKFLLRGKTSLSEDGKATISQVLDFEKLFKEVDDRKSKIIVFDITVTNPQGQSISEQKSFLVHAGEFYLGLRADKSFLAKDEKTNLKVKAVDIEGKEIKARDLALKIYRIEWIHSKRQEADGGYSYKWEKQKELVKEYRFDTDSQGNYSQEIQLSKEGEYEADIQGKDKRGNLVRSVYNLYVYGRGATTVYTSTDTKLELEAVKTDLNVGDMAEVIIKSPYNRAKALITIERGRIFDYTIKEIEGNLYKYQFPIKEEYLPNVYLSVLLQSTDPEVKFGNLEFLIDTQRRELEIEVKSNKSYYLPGEEVVLDIYAKDYKGEAVSAEMSVAVVDLSVLALKGNPKKNPLVFFYGGFPLTVATASNIKNILVEVEPKGKGGSAGMAPEAEGDLARKARGVFKETAFWQAVLRTDAIGRAQVRFTLPDNLTTWQAEALGVTKDTQLGVDYHEFMTRKNLMVVPLKPRFVIPGDSFFIGAKVFNQSKDTQKLIINFESQTLLLKDDSKEKSITLKPDKTETVYFQVQAPNHIEKGEHQFSLSAKSPSLQDTVLQYIPITPNDTYEATATANYTTDVVAREYVFLPDNIIKDKGELSVRSSATLAVFMSDALNYLLGFPYGCSEQIASKLGAIAVVKRGLNIPNLADKFQLEKIKYQTKEYTIDEIVQIGIAELYNNQKYDGGFSFWRNGESSFYLTLQVVETLNNLILAGFEVNQNVLNKAVQYLSDKITNDPRFYQNKDTVILTAYTLSGLLSYVPGTTLRQQIIDLANNELFVEEQISNTSLAYLAILLTKGFDKQLQNKIFSVLDNRINIDARGAFLEPNKNRLWHHFETTIKDTALYLKALAAAKRDIAINDKVIRWLLNSKSKDGSWGSTNNTLAVVDAFVDFLQWKRETESDFTLELFINQKQEDSFRFQPATILEQFVKELPLNSLQFNENNIVEFQKESHNRQPNNFYYDLSLKYYLPIESIPPRDEGFSIARSIYSLEDKENKNSLTEAKVGDVLRLHLQVTVPKTSRFVMIEDFIPAGMEIVNLDLATEQKSLRLQETEIQGREFFPDFKELYDDRAFLYKEQVSPGVYEFDYFVRALVKGEFSHLPAVVSEMYFPENFGRTPGGYFSIK